VGRWDGEFTAKNAKLRREEREGKTWGSLGRGREEDTKTAREGGEGREEGKAVNFYCSEFRRGKGVESDVGLNNHGGQGEDLLGREAMGEVGRLFLNRR
jgi:hypothetical protein